MASRVLFARWDPERFLQQIPERVMREYGEEVTPKLQESIAAVRYPWPVGTQRRVGRSGLGVKLRGVRGRYVREGRRDIIDTGELQDSQTPPQVTSSAGRVRMRIVWEAPYSLDVLLGGYLVNRGPEGDDSYTALPRDWITPVTETARLSPRRFFLRRYRRYLQGRSG